MLIVGELGSGKSDLLSEVVSQTRNSRQVVRLRGNPKLTPAQLLIALSKQWSISQTNNSPRIEVQLDNFLEQAAQQDLAAVLVIDDAHLLSLSALAAIAHLVTQQNDKTVYLHIILSGLPSLSEKISRLLTKKFQQIALGALSREASFRKIKTMFDQAGLQLPSAATNAIFNKMYKDSGGMPQTLERMVKKLLAERTSSEKITQIAPNNRNTNQQKRGWKAHRIRTISFILLLGVGYAFWGWQHHRFDKFIHKTQMHAVAPVTKKPNPVIVKKIAPPTIQKTEAPKPAPAIVKTEQPAFLLQIMSGTNTKALNHYIQRHHLAKDAYVMETKYKGRDWYILAYGHYKNAADAKAAIPTLPSYLQSYHPWVRSGESLRHTAPPHIVVSRLVRGNQ